MPEVLIPERLRFHFEKQLNNATSMVDFYMLNHKERTKWEGWVKYWSRKLKKLNRQHNKLNN